MAPGALRVSTEASRITTHSNRKGKKMIATNQTRLTQKRAKLAEALRHCVNMEKSKINDFSAKWLRLSGTPVSGQTLRELCRLGCLSCKANGIIRRGPLWYTVVRTELPQQRGRTC